jgi:hypothetical protein
MSKDKLDKSAKALNNSELDSIAGGNGPAAVLSPAQMALNSQVHASHGNHHYVFNPITKNYYSYSVKDDLYYMVKDSE